MWNLNELTKDEVNVSFDASKDLPEWWTQKCLTNLDLSSNVLTTISADIGNLQDLTVLNVFLIILYFVFICKKLSF